MSATALCQQLAIKHPIIKAPMAGGVDRPELVAAVSNAGGLGFIGAAYLSPDALADDCARIRTLTDRPFGINLFIPETPPALPADAEQACQALTPLHDALQLPAPSLPASPALPFEALFEVALRSGARSLSFTFGLLSPEILSAARAAGLYLIGTATSVDEAQQLEAAGVDAIVVQGSEAGGHQGSFTPDSPMIGTLALIPQVCAAVNRPVIAAGGIMDGRGIRAALTLGASAVQLGTAFLVCPESGAAPCWKQAVLNASADQTRMTRAFSGRPARGVINPAMLALDAAAAGHPDNILPFPWQNSLTKPMRSAATASDNPSYLSLWAGQGCGMAREMAAAELMQTLVDEMTHQA